MSRLTKRSSGLTVLIYLLVISLGAGGWALCVRTDGQAKLKHAFSRCNGCTAVISGRLVGHALSTDESATLSGRLRQKVASCFKVPLAMIASPRPCFDTMSSLRSGPTAPCPLLDPTALSTLCTQARAFVSRSPDLFQPSSEHLKSIVLII